MTANSRREKDKEKLRRKLAREDTDQESLLSFLWEEIPPLD